MTSEHPLPALGARSSARFDSAIGTIEAEARVVAHTTHDRRWALTHVRVLDAAPHVASRAQPDSSGAESTPALRPPDEPAIFAHLAHELDEYLAGTRRAFTVAIDLGDIDGFAVTVLACILQIPYAHVASYGEIAAQAGSPGAARAVGTVCARTPISLVIPVHRVVRANGSLGDYGSRPGLKRQLIDLEDRVYTELKAARTASSSSAARKKSAAGAGSAS